MAYTILTLWALIAGAFALPSLHPNLEVRSENETLVARAEAINFNQDYIASGAGVTYSPNEGAGTFTVSYNTAADFVVGLGWQPGDANPITYSGSFSASGVGMLSMYGWFTSPLVEYYIMETNTGYSKVGTNLGTVISDGSIYDIYEHRQVNQPSIQGTTTFEQYISIRRTPRTSGTVTIANHFAAWKAAGLSLGTYNYQLLAVESWTGSGQGSFSLAKGTASTRTLTSTTSYAGTTTSIPATGGGPVAHGGVGYTGSTTCASGFTCTYSNSYYSQCL